MSTQQNDTQYCTELFERLKKSISLKRQGECFANCLQPVAWWVIEKPNPTLSDIKRLAAFEHACMKGAVGEHANTCLKKLLDTVKLAGVEKRLVKFSCPGGPNGFIHPILQGEKLYGYLGTCYIKTDVSDQILQIFATFTDSIVREVQKEVELAKLYEQIRPRAIALSTVHTVHRLISSTLDMSELLPRIARLSLQIIRANRCSIKLVDAKKRVLLPKVTIDLRELKTRLKKVAVGKWAPGKAVKFGRPVREDDYLAVPLIDEDVIGVITVYDKIDRKPFTDFDQEIMSTLAEQAVIAIKNAELYKEQERLTMGSIKSLAAVLDTRAPGSYVYRASFVKITLAMGQALRMDESELKCLEYAVILHDAGQISVPHEVLSKPTKLTGREYRIVQEHPVKGVEIIRHMKALKSVIPIILHHHEKYDGSGYPKGLKKDQIPLGARIMAVVGAFEAMITKKPYRSPMTIEEAVAEIKAHAGTQFDPRVVDVFLKIKSRKDIKSLLEKEHYGHR